MRPEDAEVVELAAAMAAFVGAMHALFAWDERRMTDAQRARAWPPATQGTVAASPLFAPLWLVGVPLHFVRTRRSVRGVVEGIAWLVAVYLTGSIAAIAVAWALGDV